MHFTRGSGVTRISLVLCVAVLAWLYSAINVVLADTVADPAQLPAATTSQVPLVSAYDALGVPGKAAGEFYLDPWTNVKIYKLTSATYPSAQSGCFPPNPSGPVWGHDYAEGGDEVSLPYNGNTRAVLVRREGSCGAPGSYWLIDFTPGVGVSNQRRLGLQCTLTGTSCTSNAQCTGGAQDVCQAIGVLSPWSELAFTFSNNPLTPYYAYVAGTDSTIRRIDIRGTGPGTPPVQADGAGWPITDVQPQWLHQSENDQFFVWMRSGSTTVIGYEPSSGTMKLHTDSEVNEPRIDRAGQYVGLVVCPPSPCGPCGISVWDWLTDSIKWEQRCGYDAQNPNIIPFAHNSSLRRRWLYVDINMRWPGEFTRFIPDVPNSQAHLGGPSVGTDLYGNGNWIQHPTDLDDQWSLFHHYGSLRPPLCRPGTGGPGQPPCEDPGWLAPGGMVLTTAKPNSTRRLLGHPYNTTATYNYSSFAKLSPDGKYVLFTSDMNGSGRSDVFLAELPTRLVVTLVEPPNFDAGPNQGAPVPAGSHYLNVDDDPHDGDATRIQFAFAGLKDVFTFADGLLDTDIVTSVTVRWAAKDGSSTRDARAGLVVGAGEYYGPARPLPVSYAVFEEMFVNNPATNQGWTVQDVRNAKLVYEQVTGEAVIPRAQLTELVLVVSVNRLP